MLTPARRLHKICKGRRLTARREASGTHLTAAVAFVKAERAASRVDMLGKGPKARFALAAALEAALGVGAETARGLVTQLKLKKLLG